MRAIDAKTLEQLEMHYGDKDCFASLEDWFGTAEAYWINLEKLFTIADNAKKHNSDAIKEINNNRQQIVKLFEKTKMYASTWSNKQKEKHNLSTQDYSEATNESWNQLENWTINQEKLRQSILDFLDLLKSL
jgi:hypothetical protein